jgi:small subunit ribosomal protein S1
MEQPINQIENNGLNSKKLMKELLQKFNFSLPKKGSVLDGEIMTISLLNILVDLGPFGAGVVYPREFYDDPEKQKNLKTGQKVRAVLLNLENEEGLRELSLKRAQMKSAWQEVKEAYEKGEIIPVKIANLNKGGLIAEIRGIQAFMPLSQLAEEHYPKVENGNTQEIVRILQTYRNQEFQVKIIDVDEFQNKLIISEKAARQISEKEKLVQYNVGDIAEGEISEMTDFGAFVKLTDGTEALIPKSEIGEDGSAQEILKAGEKIKAKIIEVSPNKIVLSLKSPEL